MPTFSWIAGVGIFLKRFALYMRARVPARARRRCWVDLQGKAPRLTELPVFC